jgi:hypothetical protein
MMVAQWTLLREDACNSMVGADQTMFLQTTWICKAVGDLVTTLDAMS